jgi:hypothetical protein
VPLSPPRARTLQRTHFLGLVPGGHYWLPASVLLLALMSVGVAVAFLAVWGTLRQVFLRRRPYYRS